VCTPPFGFLNKWQIFMKIGIVFILLEIIPVLTINYTPQKMPEEQSNYTPDEI
jgi:hypothetical protein